MSLDGQLHPAFESVADALRRQLWFSPGGAAVCVYHRGECVVDLWGGTRNSAGEPWLRDTLSPSFSTTKGVAATALHVLVDQGLLDYDDRVARHWREFAREGKEEITVRQVLAHQSGLYHIRQMIDHADRMLDWDYMIRAIERARPIHPPGEKTGYHGLTFGFLVGEIIQRVSGRSFSEVVRTEIAEPLGLDGLYVGAPEEALPRAAELMWRQRGLSLPRLGLGESDGLMARAAAAAVATYEAALGTLGIEFELASILDALAPRGIRSFDFNANETLRATIPAANGLFTARSLARMYAALAGGGRLNGVELISSATLERATRVQERTAGRVVIPLDMRWRLGYHGVPTTWGVPRNAFGHLGYGGSGGWAAPGRELAVALIVNAGMGTPFGDARIALIGGAALASVGARD